MKNILPRKSFVFKIGQHGKVCLGNWFKTFFKGFNQNFSNLLPNFAQYREFHIFFYESKIFAEPQLRIGQKFKIYNYEIELIF